MGSLPQPGFEDRLAAILAICRKMNSERELGPLLDLIAREAAKLLDCDRASIFLLDGRRNSEAIRLRITMGMAGWAAMKRESPPAGDGTRNVLAVADAQPGRRDRRRVSEALKKRTAPVYHSRRGCAPALASHAANAIETRSWCEICAHSQDELAQQNANLWREVENRHQSHGILGAGPKIQEIVRLIERIRDSVGERADHRRERHRQGTDREGDPLHQPARAQAVCGAELRGAAGDPAGERAVRHREGRRDGREPRWGSSSRPTAARCSWTRSATSA